MNRVGRAIAAVLVLATTTIDTASTTSATTVAGLVLPANADATFGRSGATPGAVQVDLGTGFNGSIATILPQQDGSMVVGGELQAGTTPFGFWVAHLQYDGSPDPSFGVGGVAEVQTLNPLNPAAVPNPPTLVQSNGRIIVASDNDTGFERLYALTSQGAIDPTFGGGGTGHLDIAGLLSTDGTRVAADSLQRLYVLAIAPGNPSPGFKVLRFTPDGVPDNSYSVGGGSQFLPSGGGNPTGARAAFTPDDRLVVLYQGPNFSSHSLTLVRLRTDGSLDPTFATNVAGIRPVLVADQPVDLHIRDDGTILAVYSTLTINGLTGFADIWAADGNSGNGLVVNGLLPTVLPLPGGRVVAVTAPPVDSQQGPFDITVSAYSGLFFSPDPTFNPTSATPGTAHIPATTPPILVTTGATDALGNVVLGGEIRPGAPHGTPWLARLLPAGQTFVATSPARLVDTRPGGTTVDGQYAGIGPIPTSGVLAVQMLGRAGSGIGPSAKAVVLTVTVTQPKGDGFVTVYPCAGLPANAPGVPPVAANLNYKAGQTISNAVITSFAGNPFVATGLVCFHSLQRTHLVVDVSNYLPNGASYTPVAPMRLMDTRPGQKTIDGLFAGIGIRSEGSVTELQVTGRNVIPKGAVAAVLNVTSTESTAPGFVTVYPCDAPRPTAANVNYSAHDTVPNMVMAKLTKAGTVCLYTHSATHLVVDMSGSFILPGTYMSLVPARLMETRQGLTTIDGQFNGIGQRAAGAITELQVAGRGGVPPGVAAAALNVTVTEPTGPGYVTVFPCGEARPNSANLSFTTGQTIPVAVVAKLSPTGTVCLYTHSATQVVVDVSGYFPIG